MELAATDISYHSFDAKLQRQKLKVQVLLLQLVKNVVVSYFTEKRNVHRFILR